jgi:hypothetical protein
MRPIRKDRRRRRLWDGDGDDSSPAGEEAAEPCRPVIACVVVGVMLLFVSVMALVRLVSSRGSGAKGDDILCDTRLLLNDVDSSDNASRPVLPEPKVGDDVDSAGGGDGDEDATRICRGGRGGFGFLSIVSILLSRLIASKT